MICPNVVDHLVFRVAELDRTERFYGALLGQVSHRAEDSLMFRVGETRVFFTISEQRRPGTHDKEQAGLNHLAFGVRSPAELRTVQGQLDRAGVTHSGIQIDPYGRTEFIWLDDPDGLRVEFYLRP